MSELNRRDFLWLAASTGVSFACAGVFGRGAGFQVRTGVVGWEVRTAATMRVLSGMPEYQVLALSNAPEAALQELRTLMPQFSERTPALYANAPTMLQKQSLDVLFASGEISSVLGTGAHLVLEGCDAAVVPGGSMPGRCVQVLPRYEFLGNNAKTSGFGPYAGGWRRAQIRHQTGLPAEEVRTQEQFVSWMWSEIGEAVDFAREILDQGDYEHVTATAAPLVPAGTVVFGLRFHGAREP